MGLATSVARRLLHGTRAMSDGGRNAVRAAALAIGLPPSALVRYDLVPRTYYALPFLLASLEAKRMGFKGMTIVECGVGAGGGIINLCDLAALFGREFDLAYRIVGLDSGGGLPDPRDFRDHPEVWRQAQFVHDKDALRRRLTPNAKVVYGEVRETSPAVLAEVDADHPIGFVISDLDYYTSTRDALEGLMRGPAERYLPTVMMYADDVEMLLTFNSWCGEALAFNEFNEKSADRKIERKPVRVSRAPRGWHRRVYGIHILDHPARHAIGKNVMGDDREINVTTY